MLAFALAFVPTMERDLYLILGLLPTADAEVVVAAHDALLASLQPDRWRGDPLEAEARLEQIKAAYTTLSDPVARAAYDKQRLSAKPSGLSDARSDDFDTAIAGLEERWSLARKLYPDLDDLRIRMRRLSIQMEFCFVLVLIGSKNFLERKLIADQLEAEFMALYFGTNKEIVRYASRLLLHGKDHAIIALNRLTDVVGSEVDAASVVASIDEQYSLKDYWRAVAAEKRLTKHEQWLRRCVINERGFQEASELASIRGHKISMERLGLFSGSRVTVRSDGEGVRVFESKRQFVDWVAKNLC